MTDQDTLKEFEKMFELDSVGDSGQSEEYGHSTDSDESFDDLEKEMSGKISELEDKGASVEKEDPHDIIMDVASREESEEPDEKDDPEDIFDSDDDFDSIDETEKKEIVKETAEAIAQYHEEKENENESDDTFHNDGFKIIDDKIQWALESPSSMYDNFYRQKKIFLDNCVCKVGGQVEYSRWTKELEEAEVDVVSEVFDQQVMIDKMEEVQQFRNRVKYIGVRVNNQYYAFERFISLLRGYLAKVQYLKPVLKQDGLILEHMGDIELYFERLRALHSSVSITEKNLAAAYEMLSRKVTICMELPPAERYEKPSQKSSYVSKLAAQKQAEANEALDDFDDLPMNAKAGPREHRPGKISWGEI